VIGQLSYYFSTAEVPPQIKTKISSSPLTKLRTMIEKAFGSFSLVSYNGNGEGITLFEKTWKSKHSDETTTWAAFRRLTPLFRAHSRYS